MASNLPAPMSRPKREAPVTVKAAESAAEAVGFSQSRVHKINGKGKLAQFIAQVGTTRVGQIDLEVANEILELADKAADKLIIAAEKMGDLKALSNAIKRKIEVADKMIQSAKIRINTPDHLPTEITRPSRSFPPNIAIGLGVNVCNGKQADAKPLEHEFNPPDSAVSS